MTDLTTKLAEIKARDEESDGVCVCSYDIKALLRLVEVLREQNIDLRRMVDLTTADYHKLERQQDQAALEAMEGKEP